MSTDPSTWDLSGAVVADEHGEVALIEAVRRYGARDLLFGYRWDPTWGEDRGQDPPASVPVTWYATATWRRQVRTRRELSIRTETITRERTSDPATGVSHRRAQLEAIADVVRALGGTVYLVDA